MDAPPVVEPAAIPTPLTALTIKTSLPDRRVDGADSGFGGRSFPVSPAISISPNLNSPSPPSSAFVSALQSPYISPRAVLEPPLIPAGGGARDQLPCPTPPSPRTSPTSTDDTPSSTPYTPASEPQELSAAAAALPTQPRASFSFPAVAPRVSFTRASASPASSSAKLRSCDVYIGYHGKSASLARFCRWLKAELEMEGIASFVADRAKFSDAQSHEAADRIICSSAFGVVVVTPMSFLNSFSLEEIRFFAQKRNLIPLLFDTDLPELAGMFDGKLDDRDWKDAYEALVKCSEFDNETNEGNWRSCISKTVAILRPKLGRRSVVDQKELDGGADEMTMPFPRDRHFVGREKELAELEAAFFGCADVTDQTTEAAPTGSSTGGASASDGLADEESDAARSSGRFINLEIGGRFKEPTLEAWIDPVIDRSLQKQRSRQRRATAKGGGVASVVCVTGVAGIGKTELALEFAHRCAQRYRAVLWVSGEARHLRQNILNLSATLGLDVSAEPAEKERGRIRSFDEQEVDAFNRVRRELFRDVPFLIVVDDLESERDWWEGKDLHDLIPRNTGASHVIITTRLPRLKGFPLPLQLGELPVVDAMALLKGRTKEEYSAGELEVLQKFDERLGRITFGLAVVGSLLSELAIGPSALLDAVERVPLTEALVGAVDDGGGAFCRSNAFLMRVLAFTFALMERVKGGALALRMVTAGAWLAAAPVSSALLAAAASKVSAKGSSFTLFGDSIKTVLFCGTQCFVPPVARKAEVDAALLLVNLGMARRSSRHHSCWIQLHRITRLFGRARGGVLAAAAAVHGVMTAGVAAGYSDHLWASAFLVFGFKSEPPVAQLKVSDMVAFIKKTAIPLAIRSFVAFSRCGSALELLKVCTGVLEEAEKSYATRAAHGWSRGDGAGACWKQRGVRGVDRRKVVEEECLWQEVTLLKATLMETRAKLMLRGGLFDAGEELCRTCISIRTVMLGHGHAQTLAAQETLAKLVRCRSKV